jgi:integrase
MVSVSVTQRGKTSYRIRTRWTEPNGAVREVNETVRGTREFAEAKKAIIVSRFKSGQMVGLSTDTVAGYVNDWIDRRQQYDEIRETTAQTYRSVLPLFTAALGERKLSSITSLDIREWIAQATLAKSGAHARYVGSIIKKVFKQAVKEGMLPYNPFDQADLPKAKKTKKDLVLTEDQMRELWVKSYDYKWGLAVRIALETGARRGELSALRWDDITETGVINIRRTAVVLRGGKVKITQPKTERSHRKVRVSATMRDELNSMRGTASHFVLGDRNPPHPTNVSSGMNTVLVAAGNVGLSAHDLRHAHATHLLRSRIPLPTVSARLGHSKTSITLDVYGHAIEEDDEKVVGAMDGILGRKDQKEPLPEPTK